MKAIIGRLTFWRIVAVLLIGAGAVATYVRFMYGLGAATNLSDEFPWGLWIGFDVLCGVGLAAGGFTLAAIVYIFNIMQTPNVAWQSYLQLTLHFQPFILVCAPSLK